MFSWLKRKITRKDSDRPSSIVRPGELESPSPRAFKLQADEHLRAGQYAEAEHLYRRITSSDKDFPGSLIGLGFVLKEQGRWQEALQVLERAVEVAAKDADSHYLLATVLATAGLEKREVTHLQRAIALRPDFELAHLQLITALFNSHQIAEATESCISGLTALPKSAPLHLLRSNLHVQAGEIASAIANCKLALSLDPGFVEAQQSLSRLLLEADQLEQAEASYRREIELTSEHFGPYHQLGVVLTRMARHAEAIETFKRAISLNPASSASYSSLAAAYTDLDDTSEENLMLARANFKKAISVDPTNSLFHYSLGFNYWRCAEIDRAMASFDNAIVLDPKDAKARWARVMLFAPAFSNDVADSPNRSGFGTELTKFREWWVKSDIHGATFVGELQPFFLTYQEESNLELLKQYGEVCALAMERWLAAQKVPAFIRPKQNRIRLGVVSTDIRIHSIWLALIEGWFQSFDRERFELVVFSLSDLRDQATSWARTKADVFITGLKDLSQWVTAIREQNCEILLFPAVGLSPMTLKLASLRLAPVQMNAWGHPDTSGLPTLDYYISAECFEPANAQNNYSEQLIQLPALGNRVQPLAIPGSHLDFAALNISLERPILVCAGTPYKYQPAYDYLFAEIARNVPEAQLIFFKPAGAALADVFRSRIVKAFETAGLQIEKHVKFVRWLTFPEFHALLRRADMLLDTIGFSGYNTAVQAIECGLPIVTREGRFLRGRLASGVLRRLGVTELIAETEAEYVKLTRKLVRDKEFRERIRAEIQNRRSILFDDLTAMKPFQDILAVAARPGVVVSAK